MNIHKPSARALRQAKTEGIDLLALKESSPAEYKMRVAQEILITSSDFVDMASQVFFAAFPHHELLRHGQAKVRLLSFPELSLKELKRWDDALSRLALHPNYAKDFLYYRVISDKRGEERQLGLPLNAKAWQGQVNVLVGPFETQLAAEQWGETVKNQQLMTDAVPYLGYWFCDIFLAEL